MAMSLAAGTPSLPAGVAARSNMTPTITADAPTARSISPAAISEATSAPAWLATCCSAGTFENRSTIPYRSNRSIGMAMSSMLLFPFVLSIRRSRIGVEQTPRSRAARRAGRRGRDGARRDPACRTARSSVPRCSLPASRCSDRIRRPASISSAAAPSRGVSRCGVHPEPCRIAHASRRTMLAATAPGAPATRASAPF